MDFTPIDMASWPRQQYFYYFTKMNPMSFTLTATLDITATHQATHARGLRFFPAYLYATSMVLAASRDFRVGYVDERLGYFAALHPSYTVIHPDHTISSCWTAYQPDFAAFYAAVAADEAVAAHAQGPVGKPDQPANCFEAGMLPWLHFDSYTPQPVNGLQAFTPVLQAGRYEEFAGRLLMPLSITANHAVVDGYHVSQLFQALQHAFDAPTWLEA